MGHPATSQTTQARRPKRERYRGTDVEDSDDPDEGPRHRRGRVGARRSKVRTPGGRGLDDRGWAKRDLYKLAPARRPCARHDPEHAPAQAAHSCAAPAPAVRAQVPYPRNWIVTLPRTGDLLG